MEFTSLKSLNILNSFSNIGQNIFLPDGIFYWAGRAKTEAKINATIGTAMGLESEFIEGGSDKFMPFYMPSIVKAVSEAGPGGMVNYAPPLGLPAFRTAWRKWILGKIKTQDQIDESLIGTPMVTPGATSAVYLMTKLFLSPGEKLIVPNKRWENYDLVVNDMQGIGLASFNLFKDGAIDLESLEQTLLETAKTQDKLVLLINFPNNPTGFTPPRADIEAIRDTIVKAAEETGKMVALLFDDAYDGYVFDESIPKYSAFGAFVNAHPNLINVKIDSTSKEMLMYGGRVASVTFAFHPAWGDPAPIQKELENKVGALIRGSVSNSPHVIQSAVAKALEDVEGVKAEQQKVVDVLARRCQAARDRLDLLDPEIITADPFNSGFFFLLNLPMDMQADKTADRLLSDFKVGAIPGRNEALGINAIRVAFCSVLEKDVPELMECITKAAKV